MMKLLLLLFMKAPCFLQIRMLQFIFSFIIKSNNKIVIKFLKEFLCFQILLQMSMQTRIQVYFTGQNDINWLAYLFVIGARQFEQNLICKLLLLLKYRSTLVVSSNWKQTDGVYQRSCIQTKRLINIIAKISKQSLRNLMISLKATVVINTTISILNKVIDWFNYQFNKCILQALLFYHNLLTMAHVQVNKLSQQELAELACTYAALILHDDGQDITGDRINSLLSASGVKIETYWPKLFAKALKGKDINGFFCASGPVASASAAGPSSSQATATPIAEKKDDKAAKVEPKKEAPPQPKEEEEDMDMGGLFD